MTARTVIRALVAALTVTAFAGSYAHCTATVEQHGATGWMVYATAAMPEAMVMAVVLSVKSGRAPWTVWLTGVTAVAFTVCANLAQAEPTVWGCVVAVWPAWAALCALGIAELDGDPARATTVTQDEPVVQPVVQPVVRPVTQDEPVVEPVVQEVTQDEPVVQPVTQPVTQDDPLLTYLAQELGSPRRRGDVYAEAVTRFGVSMSTVKRRAMTLRTA